MEEKDFDEINSLAEYLNKKDDESEAAADITADEQPHEQQETAVDEAAEIESIEQPQEDTAENNAGGYTPDDSPVSLSDENPDATRMIDSIKNSDFSSNSEDDDFVSVIGSEARSKSDDIANHFGKNNRHEENDVPVERPKKSSAQKRKKAAALKAKRKKEQKSYERRRTFAHIFGGVLLSVLIISLSAFFAFYIVRSALDFTGIAQNEFDVEIEIPENATTDEVADILQQNGIIDLPKLFEVYSKVSDADGKYISGIYTLSSTMSYSSIVRTLQSVTKVRETVTIRITEGMTAREIGELLEQNYVCRADDFAKYYKDKQNKYSFEKRVLQNSLKFNQLEGYLFPDTYEFFVVDELKDDPDYDTSTYAKTAADKMYANFNEKITKEMYKKMNSMGLTLDELITLASMVQSEAGTVEDMQLVASVFLNRLHNSEVYPYLQSDVTVLYVENNIKPYIDGKQSDYTDMFNAYNTYVTVGIPVGPICNPGMDAIKAVLDAPSTNYYYFCANEDTLEMYYASTVAEHERNLVLAGLAE